MVRILSILTLATYASLSGGCGFIFVRWKADTILRLHQSHSPGTEVTFGVRDVIWSEDADNITIIGLGGHPREHETYAFILNEGFPASRPRWIQITRAADRSSPDRWHLDLWLDRSLTPSDAEFLPGMLYLQHYFGSFRATMGHRKSERTFEVTNVVLKSSEPDSSTILLSGNIKAKPGDRADLLRMTEWLEREAVGRWEPDEEEDE